MITQLPFGYSTININELSEEELGISTNPFAWTLFVAKQALLRGRDREERLLEKKWFLFQKLYDHGLLKDRKLQAILAFMEHYLPFEDKKINSIFKKRIDQLIGKTNKMDIFEQIREMKLEEARQETRGEIVRELLANTEFSDEKIASLTKVPMRQVAGIRKRLQSKKQRLS